MNNVLPKNNAGELFTHFNKAAFVGRIAWLCLWTAVVMGSIWFLLCRVNLMEIQSPRRGWFDILVVGVILGVIELFVRVITEDLEPNPKRLSNMNGGNIIIIAIIPLAWAVLWLFSNGQGFFWFCGGMLVLAVGTIIIAKDERQYRRNIIANWCRSCAFQNRTDLIDLAIPAGVMHIGNSAFSGCGNLRSIKIPDSVTSIDNDAFSGCSRLTSITIPDSVTSIGGSAFYNCSGLTSVMIGDGVKNIGEHAFHNCSGLTSVMIGDGVKSIGEVAFCHCTNLTSVTIPEGVTSIGRSAFSDCSRLTSITIPDSVTSIGESAFFNCSGLTSVMIGDGVKNIGEDAFFNCSGLTSVTIPEGVTSIGRSTFYNCSGLTSITIPDSVTSIGNGAFQNCSGLTSVTIPEGVTSIGFFAFSGCPLESVVIPNSVTNIGEDAFKDAKSIEIPITLVQKDWDKMSSLKEICHGVFSFPAEAGLIGAPSIRIGAHVFRDCQITAIPSSVTEVGEYAFAGACFRFPGLPALEIVKEGAFWQAMLSKDNLDIPDSLKEIGDFAFSTNDPPKTVKIGPGVLPWNCTVVSPFAAKDAFVVDVGNETFCVRGGVLFSKDGTILVSVPQGFSGDFAVPEGVTMIAPGAFWSCRLLRRVRIPSSVKTIRHLAFAECHSLVDCEIPPSVESIDSYAFRSCRSLERIRLPQNVTVDYCAFQDCVQLVTVEFDATVKFVATKNISNKRYELHAHFLGCERLSQETRDRFRAFTGQYPIIQLP